MYPALPRAWYARHPDIKWLRREQDVIGFARTQREILDALWRTLAPGGENALLHLFLVSIGKYRPDRRFPAPPCRCPVPEAAATRWYVNRATASS